jgi:release factor glutamine methyltransferase
MKQRGRLVKQIDFYGACIAVDHARALEPRQETELLVEKIVLSHKKSPPKRMLDLCCGSGAIGIALKLCFPNTMLFSSDLSQEALSLCRENIACNQIEAIVLQGDLLQPAIDQKLVFDLFVCNPPYVATNEVDLLDAVALQEPPMALFGGEDGLDFYRRLADELPRVLAPHAFIYFEIGYNQKDQVMKIFSKPCYKSLLVENDYAGHNRFFSLVFEPQPLLQS